MLPPVHRALLGVLALLCLSSEVQAVDLKPFAQWVGNCTATASGSSTSLCSEHLALVSNFAYAKLSGQVSWAARCRVDGLLLNVHA